MRIIAFAATLAVLGLVGIRGANAAPCDGFVDVDDSNATYCSAVTYLKGTGITLGCSDASHYCPNDAVTRLQMALFMQRMAGKAVFRQGGNAFGTDAILGTLDNQPLRLWVNGSTAMRLVPDPVSPTVVGGYAFNFADAFPGQTISGGGYGDAACFDPMSETYIASCLQEAAGSYATIGGGYANRASDEAATVGGGFSNVASGRATVAGGVGNLASGSASAIPGGLLNVAAGFNSLAAGTWANALHDGSMAFADLNFQKFPTIANNEFAVRATGGVRFVTLIDGDGSPLRTMKLNPNSELDFGSQTRQMLNLWGPATYGIGVQSGTLYFRVDAAVPATTSNGFSWFKGGVHADTSNTPGTGGTELMRLAGNGTLYVTGGTVGTLSDKAAKRDFADVDTARVLDRLAALPLSEWSYINNPSVRHVGPTAQDFRAAFGLGDDDARSISMVDADGVALASIQALHARERALEDESAMLREDNAALRAGLAALLQRVEHLESASLH